jgi:hypothetical protein
MLMKVAVACVGLGLAGGTYEFGLGFAEGFNKIRGEQRLVTISPMADDAEVQMDVDEANAYFARARHYRRLEQRADHEIGTPSAVLLVIGAGAGLASAMKRRREGVE